MKQDGLIAHISVWPALVIHLSGGDVKLLNIKQENIYDSPEGG